MFIKIVISQYGYVHGGPRGYEFSSIGIYLVILSIAALVKFLIVISLGKYLGRVKRE